MRNPDLYSISIFSDVSVNREGIILYSIRRILEEEERSLVMFYDGISSLRDAYGRFPLWHVRDSYLYLKGKTLMLKRLGSIEEKELAEEVLDFDSSGGKIAIIRASEEFLDLNSGCSEGGSFEGKVRAREILSKKVRDVGYFTEVAISKKGDVAYVKVESLRPLRTSLMVNGERIYSCQGSLSELCWFDLGLLCIEYPFSEHGYFCKRKILWIGEGGVNEIELQGDPGCWLELDPPGHFSGKQIAPLGNRFAVIETVRGRGVVKLIDPEEGKEEVIFSGNRTAYGISSSGDLIAICWSSPDMPSAISLLKGDKEKVVVKSRAVSLEAKERKRDFEYGGGSRKAIYVHGGPRTSYGYCFNFEIFTLTTLGFKVLGINYPGSSGYEEGSFSEALEYIKRRIPEEEAEVGKGESFGAILLALCPKGLKSVILERGSYDLSLSYLASDQGIELAKSILGKDPSIEDLGHLLKISPISSVQDFPEKILIVSSKEDCRYPFLSSIELYNRLKDEGKRPELIVIHGGHGSRNDPKAYLRALNEIQKFLRALEPP